MLGSVAFKIRLSIRQIGLQHKQKFKAKLKKLSIRQYWPLKEQDFDFIRILDISLSSFVKVLSYGPKHPIREIFNEAHILADIDKLVLKLRKSATDFGKLCGMINVEKYQRNTRRQGGVVKMAQLLKDNDIVTVPFDKGQGICVMKRQSPCYALTFKSVLRVVEVNIRSN